eukprot:CAMPEP_0170587658 /NCGR_PEP_ID=MMETSP0224-20130122/10402_1 /TAXON_ID=285029 /ORGANISM="Togula jolla, Strain CCCM 725" /LENGTH=149 /DNA_ID=CAMNT_0010911299 /DNA_START=279 /DNA_END=725 /DNA_ORIENTATION=+
MCHLPKGIFCEFVSSLPQLSDWPAQTLECRDIRLLCGLLLTQLIFERAPSLLQGALLQGALFQLRPPGSQILLDCSAQGHVLHKTQRWERQVRLRTCSVPQIEPMLNGATLVHVAVHRRHWVLHHLVQDRAEERIWDWQGTKGDRSGVV